MKPYSKYKDSGVEWLGEVPEHWSLTSIKHIAELGPNKPNIINSLKCSFVPMKKLRTDSILLDEERLVDEVEGGYTYFQDQDILMAKVTPCFENKNIAIANNLVNGIGFGSSEIYVFRTNKKHSNRYLYYRLQEDRFISIATSSMTGAAGLKRIPSDMVNNFTISIPSINEQQKIANFIDRETTRIDSLIKEKENFIALLKEKCQALISHTVTKGVDPTVKMKDSGVEWLGDVPEHWDIKPIKTISTCNDNTISDSTPSDYEIEYVEIASVKSDSGISETTRITFGESPSRARRMVQHGDIIVSTVRTYLKSISPIVNPPKNMVVSTGFAVIRPVSVTSSFLGYLFLSEFLIADIISHSEGISYPAINSNELIQLKVPVPPSSEQKKIALFISEKTKKLDALFKETKTSIELLKEHRTALISAAVTGKIDVRHLEKEVA